MSDERMTTRRVVALTSKSGKRLPIPHSICGLLAGSGSNASASAYAAIDNAAAAPDSAALSAGYEPDLSGGDRLAPPADCKPESAAVDRGASAMARPVMTRMCNGTDLAVQASATFDQKQLCGHLWYEGEICILFADTNVGKSLLAVQIADMVANGAYCSTTLPELRPETLPQPVVYADFELSVAQFTRRYSMPHPDDGSKKVFYDFSPRFNRVELFYDSYIEDDAPGCESKEFADQIISDLALHLEAIDSRVLIIDNITFMASGTETAADAMPLMKRLVALKKKLGISILLLAHTPKRSLSNPLTRNDLQGSKMLINFADSAFAIGESNCGKDVRYIKQIKQRNCEQVYDAENVLVCRIGRVYDNFIGFTSIGTDKEKAHLAETRYKPGQAAAAREQRLNRVRELREAGMSAVDIAGKIGVSRSTAFRMVSEIQ